MIVYPRVNALVYRIQSDEEYQYAAQAECNGALREFTFRLHYLHARFTPSVRFADVEQARAALEPQLRAWDLFTALEYGRRALQFIFLNADVQEQAPPPGAIQLEGASMAAFGCAITKIITLEQHPPPPQGFAVDECVETLGALFLLARTAPTTLLYVAYSMTTCLEYHYQGFAGASKRLSIAKNVLQPINVYANERGVGAEVRKFNPKVQRKPLSLAEREGLIKILEEIVRRAGLAAAGAIPAPPVTLATIPLP